MNGAASLVQVLGSLFPGMSSQQLEALPVALLSKLASYLDGISLRLVQLKDLFPTADISVLASRRYGLALCMSFTLASGVMPA